nr:DEAD/DEAH box helicase family protein [uncultured Dethiosulfovibrio sp.]
MRANDGNPCLVMPTGSGKSHVIAGLCLDALRGWPDTRILILSHVKELLQQDADKIFNAWPEAPLGVYSAGLGKRDLGRSITVAGIQSIRNKAEQLGHVDMVIVDECHLISHKKEGGYRHLVEDLTQINQNLRVIGLTATPYRLGHGLITDEPALFSGLIEPVKIEDLIERGHLAPLRSKLTQTLLSTEGVATRGGEYVEWDLQRAVNNEDDNRYIVQEVLKWGRDRKSWLFFCTGVDHAIAMRDELRAAGVSAETVLGNTPKDERSLILERFKAGEIRALTNNSVLCLDEETEILTAEGFVGIDNMSKNHLVAGWKPDGSIDFSVPKRIIKRQRAERENMAVFGNGNTAEIRVTEGHRMVVLCGGDRKKTKVVPAQELVGKRFCIPAFGNIAPLPMAAPAPSAKAMTSNRRVVANSYNYRKKGYPKEEARRMAEDLERLNSEMRYKNPDELTLAECSFIGFWLGDGTFSGGLSVTQSTRYADTVEWFDGVIKEAGLSCSRSVYPKKGNMSADAIRWTFGRGTGGHTQRVQDGYFRLEPYLKKEGTSLFLGLNKEQLEALLHGFWEADGRHHGKTPQRNEGRKKDITGTQLPLYKKLQEACSMRGISAWISGSQPRRKANHSLQYRFSWGGRRMLSYVKDSSRLETEFKEERVWCVESSTSFLICRRKGKVFVTGNCTGFDHPGIDLLAMCRPTKSPSLYLQMAGRGMRVKPQGGDCLVLDFAGVVSSHGPITSVAPPRRKGDGTGEAPVKVCEQCQEFCHLSAKVCPACGNPFPEPEKQPISLHEEDIMGIEPQDLPIEAWEWSVHMAKSGIETLKARYYGPLYISKVDEYLTVLHEGYAGRRANKMLHEIAVQAGADLSQAWDIQQLAEVMGNATPPRFIRYKKDGKFDRIVDRSWGDPLGA